MKHVFLLGVALLGLGASEAALAQRGAGKPVVAVTEFRNESGAAWWRGGVGWELAGMLTNELAATKDFKVVERNKIEDVLSEQNLAASGRVAPGTGAKIGKLTGAQYLITGTVTAYEEETSSTGGGISFGGVSLGGKSEKAYLAIDLRVINATTGEVDFVRTIEGNAKGGGQAGAGAGVSSGSSQPNRVAKKPFDFTCASVGAYEPFRAARATRASSYPGNVRPSVAIWTDLPSGKMRAS